MGNKIMLGILIVFCFLIVTVHAKDKEQVLKQLTADDIVAKMKVQLQLTDNQVEEVKPIIANYLTQELQLKIEEKNQLSHVLTGDQMFTWNFLQNEKSKEKKKH